MRAPGSPVPGERGRDLGDPTTTEHRFDDHFAGELHARGPQLDSVYKVASQAAKAAMKVAHRCLEEESRQAAERRVSEVSVHGRHGAARDAAQKAVADDQIEAFAQFVDEGIERVEVVAAVGIADDDQPPATSMPPRMVLP
jgi:hypothetical protein